MTQPVISALERFYNLSAGELASSFKKETGGALRSMTPLLMQVGVLGVPAKSLCYRMFYGNGFPAKNRQYLCERGSHTSFSKI
jgi:hypothetical protein